MKYKHLYTWDTLMGSYDYWKDSQQALAEHDNAPIDAIYKRSEDKGGDWERASTLTPTHRFWDTHRAIHGETA